MQCQGAQQVNMDPTSLKYGLLITHTDNIGDEIQSLAVRRLLPRVDRYIDRDKVNYVFAPDAERILAILNGWWCHNPENWPPSRSIVPLLLSFHLSPFRSPSLGLIPIEIFLSEPAIRYLKHFGPVGARDLGTLEVLQKAGIDSYFSACITLTLERPDVQKDNDLIVLNDVPEAVARLVSARTGKRVVQTTHAGYGNNSLDERFAQANRLLELYAKASCVVTTRLHCALPCAAMGTSVLLLDTATDRKRFAGLIDFVHHFSLEQFTSDASQYCIDHPPLNPGKHLDQRATLIESVKQFVSGHNDAKPYPFGPVESLQITYAINAKIQSYVNMLREKPTKT